MVAMHSTTRLSVKLDSKLDQEAEGSVIDGDLVARHKGVWGSGSQYYPAALYTVSFTLQPHYHSEKMSLLILIRGRLGANIE
jgi:hypothetical protein